jgi:iron complex outermembrane receptor protein
MIVSFGRGRPAARFFVSGSVAALAVALIGAAPAAAQDTTPATGNAATQQTVDPSAQPNANPASQSTTQATNASVDPTPVPADSAANQTAEAPGAGEDIVVTGFRASLASSAKIKRNSTLIVDSVSAEDVGKLPDVSIADALARIPGVTAQRLEGRDQRLSIRGLGPDFSTTLLNGREQVTVGDNRAVEYDQYPSEFFQNVNVYKSADASLIASGISGTVDLRMLRPLDQANRIVAINVRGQMNGIDKLNPDGTRYGYRASATYVDKFAGDTLGIAIGVAATQTPSQNERYNAWGYAGSGTSADPYVLGGAKPYVQSNLLKRYGAVGTIEWQPSDSFHSTFDALYSNFKEEQTLRGIEFPLGFSDPVRSNVAASNGFVTGATFSNVFAVQRNDYNRRTADNLSLGWNNDLKLTDRIHLNVDASWSRATRTDLLLETNTGTGFAKSGVADTVRIAQKANGTYTIVPTLDYTNTGIFKLTDPQGWGNNGTQQVVQAGFINRPKFTDDLKSLRASLNGEIEGSVLSRWEVGGNYTRREKVSDYTNFFLCPRGGGTGCTVASGTPRSIAVPQDALLGTNVALQYLGIPAMLTYDPLNVYNNALNAVFDPQPSALVRDNTVLEKVWTGYGKLSIDGEVGGKVLKGALGAQVIHTEQSSVGQIANVLAGRVTIAPASQTVKYTRVLPSATFNLELIPNGFVKLGASQTMVRPRLDQERVTQDVAINTANITVNNNNVSLNPIFTSTGGNVALRPYASTNIDISLEKYFPAGGYVALAGYFKNLTDFVDPNNSYAYDFSALLPSLTAQQQAIVQQIRGTIGNVSAPANTGRGEVLGVEATLSLPLKAITSALDGFGFFVTGNYSDSTVKYANNQAITLPGLSKWVGSGTFFFEKWGFSARANYRYRSSFLAEVAGLSANPTYRTARSEGILDAQIGYEFQDGALKGLSVMAQGKNLTDRPFITYQNDDVRQVIDYQRYGRDYYIGLTYKF